MHANVRVDSYTTPLDAELAKAFLESHAIAVRFEGEALVGSAYALGPILGGIRLLVDEQDESRARRLLDDYHRALRRSSSAETDSAVASDDFDDSFESREDSPDAMVSFALGATLLAFVLLPVVMHLYAIALLLRVPLNGLSPKARKQYAIAWILNLAVVAAAAWLVVRAAA